MERRKLNPTEKDALEHLLRDLDADLDAESFDEAAELLAEAETLAGVDHPEVVYARALLEWERTGPEAARPFLVRVVELDPEHADARHALALMYEAEDDHAGMVEQFLEVLRLEVLANVPEEFRERLGEVPVVLEPRPSPGIVGEGFDPRAFGLFEGLEDRQAEELAVQPTRVVLFCANLLAAFPDDEQLAEQIEITILHELGHFFGLDEEDVARLGLE
jgi:predicted Zn-dependent protease with MMP-like domain